MNAKMPLDAATQRGQRLALTEEVAVIVEIAAFVVRGLAVEACRRLRRYG